MAFQRLQSDSVSVALDLRVGHLRDLELHHAGRILSPLFTAPWVDTPGASDLPVEQYLSGDFFCAPFAASDIDPAPLHGWSANSSWTPTEEKDQSEAEFTLDRHILGATLVKTLRCSPNAPLLYQRHSFVGGSGSLPVAHHVITHMQNGGRVCHSPKQFAATPAEPTEPGLNHLTCPEESANLQTFPSRTGTADLGRFPLADRHEDFVSLIEQPGSKLGWTAVLRKAEGDILFVLKDPATLPATMHWYAHGANMRPPWNGHHGVFGIEDGCSGIHSGHRASIRANGLSLRGISTALDLDPSDTVSVAHVIGAIGRPPDWDRVEDISVVEDALVVTGSNSPSVSLPFDADFFGERTTI
ncbi:hypothetical protein BWR17_19280 (plasmid) [Phaeobacter inhibens]|uniref:hypothetical protein n=1 Tax=Phaeobacter inhibens TaxID=221822 RepID=UPI00097193DC|nr:hypothetical protein [Phaeobacter inhibens]APX18031.1 hypothetical protein BWR17_19280 [Phaeobacter inhibens]